MSTVTDDPRRFWAGGGRTPTLAAGTILRAREIEDPSDPYAVVVVIGVHWPPKGEEAVIQPLGFGQAVSAPVSGPDSLLSVYDVLTEEEAAEARRAVQEAA